MKPLLVRLAVTLASSAAGEGEGAANAVGGGAAGGALAPAGGRGGGAVAPADAGGDMADGGASGGGGTLGLAVAISAGISRMLASCRRQQ